MTMRKYFEMRSVSRFKTALGATLIACAGTSFAQSASGYPEKSVKIVVPFPAASASDNIGRLVMEELGKSFGTVFFADNKPGASGIIGTDLASRAPADGYTLVISSSSTHSVNPWIFKKLPYDPIKGSTNISCLAVLPQVILVASDSGFKNVEELLKFGRTHPGKLSYSYGTPTSQVAGAAISGLAGVQTLGVSYKGATDAMLGLMRGDTQYMLADLSTAISQIRAGKLKALAISSAAGSPLLPGVPSFKDAGFKDFNMVLWVGLSGPAGMPRSISNQIATHLQRNSEKEEVKKRYADWGIERCANGQERFEQFVIDQYGEWKAKIQELGLQPE